MNDASFPGRPGRRRALARQIPSLALMGYQNPGTADPRYSAATLRELAYAHWFFDPTRSPGQWQMTDDDVNAAYNQCRVGLCLSSEEGTMWASIQYLLAGMPVVSTPSKGGRDEFFDAPHVRIAEPTPEAIAVAVGHQVAMRHDPERIRNRTLERMEGHRARFIAHVQARFTAAGESRRFAEEWRQVIPHRLIDMRLVGRGKQGAIADHNRRIVAAAEREEPYPLCG